MNIFFTSASVIGLFFPFGVVVSSSELSSCSFARLENASPVISPTVDPVSVAIPTGVPSLETVISWPVSVVITAAVGSSVVSSVWSSVVSVVISVVESVVLVAIGTYFALAFLATSGSEDSIICNCPSLTLAVTSLYTTDIFFPSLSKVVSSLT